MISKILFLVLIFSLSPLHADIDYNKYLKSEVRSQIILQKLVEDEGDYLKAIKFGKLGHEKYNKNIFILSYYGKAMYLNGDLENSKIIFMNVLAKDPTNDIASEFIKKIEEQELAQKNKDLEITLGYLSNQGLDFLMIFLGFLGAEVLAKRYGKCESNNSKEIIHEYIWIKNNQNSINLFFLKNYIKNIFICPICSILQIVILTTTAICITLIINWLELMGYLKLIISEDKLKIITTKELWLHFLFVLLSVFIVMIIYKISLKFRDRKKTEIDIANELQTIALKGNFELLKECVDILLYNNINMAFILKYFINEEAEKSVLKLISLCQDEDY